MKAKRGGGTQGTVADGAQEVRAHATEAKMWGMVVDGARDGAEIWGCRGMACGPM